MFDMSKVSGVYSGRKGCACGCRGKYAYASAHKGTRPSYYEGDEAVSDKTVKTIVNKVDRLLRDPSSPIVNVMIDRDGEWLAVDMMWDRTYTIYFR